MTPNIKKLNKYRNIFIHYIPLGRSIDVYIFKEIADSTITLIELIAKQSNRIIIYGCDNLGKIVNVCRELKKKNTICFEEYD